MASTTPGRPSPRSSPAAGTFRRYPRLTFFTLGLLTAALCGWFLINWLEIFHGAFGMDVVYDTRPAWLAMVDDLLARYPTDAPALFVTRHAFFTGEQSCRHRRFMHGGHAVGDSQSRRDPMRTADGMAVRAEPNVTPMIDVMLVLLIIFMVLTPTIMTGLAAVPPEGENLKARPEEPEDQTLGIDRAGAFYLNGQRIREADLAAELRRRFSSPTGDKVLYVRADKQLQYGEVHRAIDVAAESGVRVVALIGERRSSSGSAPGGADPDAPGEEPRR